FFFSSRRRHTRFSRDWSSDVCSSDLAVEEAERMVGTSIPTAFLSIVGSQIGLVNNRGVVAVTGEDREISEEDVERVLQAAKVIEIGRASCRERVYTAEGRLSY